MLPLVKDNLPRLIELCLKHHVHRLELFGSAATNEFKAGQSDLDFLVEFSKGDRRGFDDVYFLLLEDLERLFKCHVDLVESSAIQNPFVRKSVNATKVPLYAAA